MTATMNNMINWNDLVVVDAEGDVAGTLGELVASAPANLDNCVLDSDGAISEWEGYFVGVDAESADWQIPANVNWDGLAAKLGR